MENCILPLRYFFAISSLFFFSDLFAQPTIAEIDQLIADGNQSEESKLEGDFMLLKEIDSLSKEINYFEGMIFANLTLARYVRNFEPELMLDYVLFLDSLYHVKQPVFSEKQTIEYFLVKGYSEGIKGNDLGELNWYIKADSVEQFIGDLEMQGLINFNLSSYYWNREESEKGIAYTLLSAQCMLELEDSVEYAIAMTNAAYMYLNLQKVDSAIFCAKKAHNIEKENRHQVGFVQYYQIMGEANLSKGNFDEAECFVDSLAAILADSLFDYSAYRANYLLLSGEIHINQGQFDKGISDLQKGLEIADSIDFTLFQIGLRDRIMKAHFLKEGRGDLLEMLTDFNKLRSTIHKRESLELEKQLSIQFETSKKEIEIERLRYKNQKQRTTNTIIVFSSVIVLIMGFLVISRITRKRKLLKEQLHQSNEKNKQISKKLDHMVETIKENTAIINTLKSELKGTKNTDEIIARIMRVLDNNYLEGKHWTELVYYFDQLHDRFSERIKIKYPVISNIDLQLLILIKLGYSNKEIAAIRNISEVGVKKGKQRLLKKMELSDFSQLSL